MVGGWGGMLSVVGGSVVGGFNKIPFLNQWINKTKPKLALLTDCLTFVNLFEITRIFPRKCLQSNCKWCLNLWPLDIKTERWKECFSDSLSISGRAGMNRK